MAETHDFLLEIGCEEMPSAPLTNAQAQLGKLVEKQLDASGLNHGRVKTLSSPRRLAVIVEDCASATDEVHETNRGPATSIAFDENGEPTKAALGFARKFGVEPHELTRRVDSDGREYLFAERVVESRQATPLLSELCENVISSLEWPNYRSQRWGSEHQSFVRPIRWIVALLGSELVPCSYADVVSGRTTRGHRVLAPGDHELDNASNYEALLESIYVLGEMRRAEVIREGIAAIEQERSGSHVDTPAKVFDEVVNLCEWPTLVVGAFDEEFLSVPHEIICESMLSHQRYFPIYDAQGQLTREFVIVSNANPAVNDTVRAGNERVVRPRLDDAKFFYEEDLKQPLEAYVERLDQVVFQERLGTVGQKAARMSELAAFVAKAVGADEAQQARSSRAALLAKADLVTQAVVEFTSQQGVMGGYYATAAGEAPEVATAISEHYRPRFAGDEPPTALEGRCVSIADKLDTVAGIFAINEPPTGSSDPYAIRRSAIGIIATLRKLPACSLDELIAQALDLYEKQGLSFDRGETQEQVRNYFAGRLAAIAREEGARPDSIEAVSAVGIIDPNEYLKRVSALEAARSENPETFDDLATAYARSSHLADRSLGVDVVPELLGEAETALLAAIDKGSENVKVSLAGANYAAALSALAELREPIDRFFADVLVMDEDTSVRENRLRLLNRFSHVFEGVADIGALARKG
ncbi:MAG: glycine--tRNA ligase subunit beta [Atopobiaceae bacterium]|nr:glycine--tRNA ligase subunit beta [Atopobiaceae bacterium]